MSDMPSDIRDESIVAVNGAIIDALSDLAKRFDPRMVGYCAAGCGVIFLAAHGVLPKEDVVQITNEVLDVINKHKVRHEHGPS